jgi:hypothetical protein
VELVERVRGLPRLEAERVAFQIVLVEFLNRTYPNTPSDRCAQAETPDKVLLPFSVGARHAWLHSECCAPWRERRRAEAIAALAEAGITRPPAP